MHEDERDVHDALASHADDFEVRRELHRVPPHVTYEVMVDGTHAVCKLAIGPEAELAREARTMQHVAETTSVPVPRVLAVGGDHFVAEWSDDLPASDDRRLDEARARAMGAGLATLHRETAFDAAGFLRAADGGIAVDEHRTWHETVCAFLAKRREFLVGHDRGREYAAVAADALAFVRDCPDLFEGCGVPVLCHGNYVPEHVGVDGEEVTCVIDFEHALAGPGEYDYWRTALPMFVAPGGPGEAEHAAFRAGYESVRPLPDGFDRRRPAYVLVNTVSYFRSLFLQARKTDAEMERHAEWLRERVHELIDALDARP